MIATIVLIIFLVFALAILFVITSAFLGFLMTRVPFVTTYASDVEFFVKKLGLSSSDVFYDLGSGDGKVCFLVNQLTGAKCIGFELTWWTYLLAKIRSKFKNQKSKLQFKNHPVIRRGARSNDGAEVKFVNGNFFKYSWSEANIIYGYLFPPLMGRVEEKFLTDCKPGSIAVIRDFPFPRMAYTDKFYLPKKHEIYIYKKV